MNSFIMFDRIKSSTYALLFVTCVSKVIGLFRDIVLAKYFGTSAVSDAYLIAISVPTLLFYFVGNALSTAYLPMFNKIKTRDGRESAMKYSNLLITISMFLCTSFVLLLLLFPEPVIKLFASGFDTYTVILTSRFIRISSFSIYLMVLINIWSGFLQSQSNYIVPGMISIPRNIIVILSIILAALYGLNYLGIGILLGYFFEYLVLLPFVLKYGYKPRFHLSLHSNDIKETMYLAGPIIVGISVSQVNKIIDKSIASSIVVGGVSALNYASIINNAIQEVLVTAVITVLFAKCSALVAEGKEKEVKEKLSRTINTLLFLLVPASFGVITCSELIVKCILCRGEFNQNSLVLTSGALICYTVGLSFLAVRDTLVKIFYAYKETKITTITSIIAIVINIILNFILSHYIGIKGLALATSVSAIFHCFCLYYLLRRKINDFGLKAHVICFSKSLMAGIIMFLCLKGMKYFLYSNGINDLLSLFILICIGALVYLILSIILKNDVLTSFIRNIKNK